MEGHIHTHIHTHIQSNTHIHVHTHLRQVSAAWLLASKFLSCLAKFMLIQMIASRRRNATQKFTQQLDLLQQCSVQLEIFSVFCDILLLQCHLQKLERVCCLLVLNSVTSTPQWIRQPKAAWWCVCELIALLRLCC